ncbi:2,3-bisphosphoglycerate-independent phosphoglycerate mutase [Candidatus Peregrinibacteria bacterium CG_4_9_14_0_2_um_filter_53_11]|nr:MAG: 2,3-bisphosphoglycerate-independent phosphoglycerate mutase [Candidatus Peregrinibacteria bacterium CG_4_9_14_0_2_um_filter_53_11]
MKKALLIIVDGLGEGADYPGNAVTRAELMTLPELKKTAPWTLLQASGEAVGVPEETMGGSEVGHFTMGAGRIVFQTLETINKLIKNREFFYDETLIKACTQVKRTPGAALHLLGMISDQGIHAHIAHLFALLEITKEQDVPEVIIHAITDGRDVPESSAKKYIKQIEDKIEELGLQKIARIGSVIGRYYAMDRDSNWDRLQKAYDLYTEGEGQQVETGAEAIDKGYEMGAETDYYIRPVVVGSARPIRSEDAVIFFNFRTDRARQLTWAFTGEHDELIRLTQPVGERPRPFFVCFGDYSKQAPVLFPTPIIRNNLGTVIAEHGLRQFRLAETEKYAHVTYFFNSQVETPLPKEDRLMIDSPKCPSYAQKPEMSAAEITDTLLTKLNDDYALIVVNFANCDLVGHSGDLPAALKAMQVVDSCLGRILPAAEKAGYTTLITGDHGNIESMLYENGSAKPSHTRNPVPFIIAGATDKNLKLRTDGGLQDVAPTILDIMGVTKPAEMSGNSLIVAE